MRIIPRISTNYYINAMANHIGQVRPIGKAGMLLGFRRATLKGALVTEKVL